MKRALLLLTLFAIPVLALADSSSLTFTPPAGDYSVIFLSNLFGVVDGVLHGTGSQIVGAMFSVFNSAVLALGGMIIMYTLMVSTMNTAHEGQMLGQKWSSIWIPVRSTLGLALLIPKASGYCLMQIFVMWVVVQGIGAADKIWEAALSYLNRGGVIIQAQATNPTDKLIDSQKPSDELVGATAILTGQVCMLGLQKQLEAQRQTYLDQANKSKTGACSKPEFKALCQTAIPDFISSVNMSTVQSKNKNLPSYEVPMPNFDSSSPYSLLNGICGKITWNSVPTSVLSSTGKTENILTGQTSAESEVTQMSRALAVQAMYFSLTKVAQAMVNNSPQIGTLRAAKPESDMAPWAIQQFGVPLSQDGNLCQFYSWVCYGWGAASIGTNNSPGVLFSGREVQDAVKDYTGVMMPVLRLAQLAKNSQLDYKSKAFIAEANAKGWIMAGSYFFDLVKLNGNAVENANLTDTDTGLGKSQSDPSESLLSSFKTDGTCTGERAKLCEWFGGDGNKLINVISVINGSPSNKTDNPNLKLTADRKAVRGIQSSTVNGFVNNSLMIQTPGQPGLEVMQFPKFLSITPDTKALTLEWMDFPCGGITIIFFKFCLGWMLGNVFYNLMFLTVYNLLISVLAQLINQLVMAILMIPLIGMSNIFKQGVTILAQPGVNPIVALANMGVHYINFAGNLWLMLLTMAAIPGVGTFIIMPLIALAMPLVLAWLGIMVAIGFTTAFYIPILPYMIFTFASIAWIICVIEAMVAAPLVALGVTHPEGHDAFGKGEQAIMILMNVFLRPAMMIIGYITAISLSYVGVWILNAGFDHAISFIQGGPEQSGIGKPLNWSPSTWGGGLEDSTSGIGQKTQQAWDQGGSSYVNKAVNAISGFFGPGQEQGSGSGATQFTGWAGIYAFFFSILIYTMMYLIIVQKAFTLITHLPDKVLRWIGGQAESAGQEAAQWGEEVKRKGEEAGKETQGAQAQIDKKLGAYGEKGLAKLQGADGSIEAQQTKK